MVALCGTPGVTSYLRMLSRMAGLCAEAAACRASQAAKGALSSYLCMPCNAQLSPLSVGVAYQGQLRHFSNVHVIFDGNSW